VKDNFIYVYMILMVGRWYRGSVKCVCLQP